MQSGVLSAIGKTPLIQLTRVLKDIPFRLYAKLEALNPGGSTKDRPAATIIEHGLETGLIRSGTVVIESSSGNMGIGLAQACAYYGLRFICVVDPKVTSQNIRLLKAYGAEIDHVRDPDPVTGDFLQARIKRVQTLLRLTGNSFWPNQYANVYNPRAHYQTMREIDQMLDGKIDYLFCATSTCGTLRGCAEYVRARGLQTKIFAVDAVGSVIFGGPNLKRLIPGHGAAIRPELYQAGLSDSCVRVNDLDCIIGCRRLIRKEAILAGGSSGAVLMAIEQVKDSLAPDSTCVAILPDRGERYLDTIYSDAWVLDHFGDVSHIWEDFEARACETATF
jgi:N-(2-amino-2-carboxyethyl)-L-glutamate synthase